MCPRPVGNCGMGLDASVAIENSQAIWPLFAIAALVASTWLFEWVYDFFEIGRAVAPEGNSHPRAPDRLVKPGSDVLHRPGLALPTVALAIASLVGWCASIFLFTQQRITGWQAWALSSLCTFVVFTPLHDSLHGSVAPKCRWLNELVGHACGVPLLLPLTLARHLHLTHHKHTNDESADVHGLSADPDHWGSIGSGIELPLRWATVLLWYSYWGKKDYAARKEVACRDGDIAALQRLRHLRNSSFGFWSAAAAGMLGMWYCRDASPIVCWILPATTASFWLTYFFAYVPHRAAGLPRAVPHNENPYLSTSVTRGLFGTIRELDILLLSQNYHNIHHLFPFVPFYRYRAVWEELESVLAEKGTRVLPLLLGQPHLQKASNKSP